ncbi:putative membrane protein [Escherichia coli 3-373-03_S4_C3]|nr:putative membrane protein [Escherichia coli B90]EZK07041.1 putative membrane protein [Escherichia coli 1-182-04_S3_C1]KDU23498.1 putative membrane protein [Escherichia coli 3-373-03_S4_C2]KDU44886.1 putative membrane protein [Escherichia coli 3-373-03_S4_C1]KDW26015.1 putative membrane protein [Escherichia coli 2-177-06_S3_C1]KEL20183.1 putative membrane protein [Escherichia coli 3-373-03_S4_C3]
MSDSGVFLSYVMELFLMLSLLDVISFILIARMLFNIHKIT